ncbi:alpha/beta hydrolase family protein [Candidatus Latescibacterota bacterium]
MALHLLALLLVLPGCGDGDGDSRITGPDLPTGPGRVYPVAEVTFTSADGVPVSAIFGQLPDVTGPSPAVILVHELGAALAGNEWLLAGLFEDLLESGYLPLAIDMRGHGNTPVPDDGRSVPQLILDDLDDLHLDVQAALNWLAAQTAVDAGRIGVVGNGGGGNVAFVSMGAFPEQLQAGVALSPGLWEANSEMPLVIGEGIDPFIPHSMLYVVGSGDVLTSTLSYVNFATTLASLTQEPKSLVVLEAEASHGLELLANPAIVTRILSWLEANL